MSLADGCVLEDSPSLTKEGRTQAWRGGIRRSTSVLSGDPGMTTEPGTFQAQGFRKRHGLKGRSRAFLAAPVAPQQSTSAAPRHGAQKLSLFFLNQAPVHSEHLHCSEACASPWGGHGSLQGKKKES